MTDEPLVIPGVDSYLSMEAADEIASKRLFSEPWSAAGSFVAAQALMTASALLDRAGWAGETKLDTQPMAWPRINMRDDRGFPIAADTVPAAVQTACVELAIHLLTAGQIASPAVQMRQLGDAMTMFFPHVPDELPKHVRRLIEPYLTIRSANVARVTL